MKATALAIPDILLLAPQAFGDERGWFLESFNHRKFAEMVGQEVSFVQDNHSRSVRGVLRGIHFQIGEAAQGKLVRVTRGEVFDIAVDLRRSSATFGEWVSATLSAENKNQLWVPAGFGHAFLVISEIAEVQYKVNAYWSPEHERSLLWKDPVVGVRWPKIDNVQLSDKDSSAETLRTLIERGDLF